MITCPARRYDFPISSLFLISSLVTSFPQISMVKIWSRRRSSPHLPFPFPLLQVYRIPFPFSYRSMVKSEDCFIVSSFFPTVLQTVFPLLRHRIKETSSFPFTGCKRSCNLEGTGLILIRLILHSFLQSQVFTKPFLSSGIGQGHPLIPFHR